MAIKKVKAKSGQMYDANSPQGQMIVNSATTGKDADFDSSSSSLGADVGMAETLQLIYGETQESSESLDNIEESLVDDGKETAEERAARLAKSNKDKKGNKFGKALGFAKDKIAAGTAKLKGSLSGKFGLALLGGGLLLLNKYGDEIAGPDGWLTKFLKYMKESFIPNIRALYETVTGEGGLTEKLKKEFDDAWASMTGFLKFFSDIGKSIKTYFKTFDTNDDGILDGDEAKVMFATVWTDIKAAIFGLAVDTAVAIANAIGIYTIGKMALASILGPAGLAVAAPAAAGLLGTAALVAVVAAGLWLLTEKVSDAYQDAVTDAAGQRESFKTKEFIARFFGGADEDGGFFNSVNTGMSSALIGAAIGTAVFPGLGTAVGAAVGALIGAVIGVTGGALGKKKIKTWLDGFEIAFGEAVDSTMSYFDRIIVAAKAAITPGGNVDAALAAYDATKNAKPNSQQDINNQRIELKAENVDLLEEIDKLENNYRSKLPANTVGFQMNMRERNEKVKTVNANLQTLSQLPAFKKTSNEAKLESIEDDFENKTNFLNAGFNVTDYLLRGLPDDISKITSRDLYNFIFKDSIFDKDFEAIDAAELVEARAAGFALEDDGIGGVNYDKSLGNIGAYRKFIESKKTAKLESLEMIMEIKRELAAIALKKGESGTKLLIGGSDNSSKMTQQNANFVSSTSARNMTYWGEYYAHKAANN